MVAIKDKRPVLMGVIEILDGYIAHQIDVVTRSSIHDLNKANERKHIVEGLIKAISILVSLLFICCIFFFLCSTVRLSAILPTSTYLIASKIFSAIRFITGTHTELPACLYNRASLCFLGNL